MLAAESLNLIAAASREAKAVLELSQMLGTSLEVGAKRSLRALKRIGDMLATLAGGLEGL